MCKKIKNVYVEAQVFIKGEPTAESFGDVYLIESDPTRLTVHYYDDDVLAYYSFPINAIEYYRVHKDVEYWEEEEEDDDDDEQI